MNAHLLQDIIENLLKLYRAKKHLTYDDIMVICDTFGVPLTRTETVLTEIIDRGCKVFDHIPTSQELDTEKATGTTFDSINYAQIDYEALYNKVLQTDPNLKTIINYARQIRPAQHGETIYIFKNQGNTAEGRKRLFDMNFRSVINIAYHQYLLCNEELTDLIQLGAAGLLMAIDKYDVDGGSPFASYANSWVFQNINRGALYRKNGCYFPVHISDTLKQIEYMSNIHTCSECNGTKLYCPNLIAEIQNRYNFSMDETKTFLSYTQRAISFEDILENQSDDFENYSNHFSQKDTSLLKFQYSNETSPFEEYCKLELKERIEHIFTQLSKREQEVIKYRFGFIDDLEWTLAEVGKIYNITRERVRQIEFHAIQKMKHTKEFQLLKDFWR